VNPRPQAIPDVPGFAYYDVALWVPGQAHDVARLTDGPFRASRDALEQHFSYFDTQD